MAAHALLSASSAKQWLNCTPSARLTEKLEDTGSVYAAEGTLAHSLGELELRYQLKQITKNTYSKELKMIQGNELYSEDMPDQIEKYTGYVYERLAEAKSHTPDALIFLEQRLDFSKYVPEGFGTGDCIIIADGTMEIIDLKYGKGVEVSAEDNPQMKLYSLGALEEYGFIYDIDQVQMTIVQPRLDNISVWQLSVKDLLEWANGELAVKAKEAYEGNGEPAAGDWCKFCKVKATCKARVEAVLAATEKFELKDPHLLNIEEIAEILHKADEIQAWAKDLQEYALEQARDNNIKYPGWKLVEGRSNRKYADEDQVAKVLTKEGYEERMIFTKKLKGITDMEKELGKKIFTNLLQDYIIKPPGKPALVVESDKRPELNSVESDFDL
jgi:hypothetical protein